MAQSPSSSTARYESFLVKNVSTIATLESSLRSITWFLPGRFKDAELASEALTALLNLMSMYNDTLLAKLLKNNPKYRPLIPPSLSSRFARAWMEKDKLYKWAARLLEVIRFTELVVEMGLKRKASSKTRWRGIIFLEVVKAALRLMLLKRTRRPLISPPIPERDLDPTTVESLSGVSNSSSPTLAPSSPPASLAPTTPDHLRNNQVPLSVHPLLAPSSTSSGNTETIVDEFLLPKALTTTAVRPSLSLMNPLTTPQEWVAEVIYVLRPLVYASLLVADRRSNRALVTVLSMEFLSRNLRRAPSTSAALERTEYARRDRDMIWYLLRGSIWESYTRLKLDLFVAQTATRPVLGVLGALLKDWIPLIDEYYYYTAP